MENSTLKIDPEVVVRVRRQWNDQQIALYRLTEISTFHWSTISGGVAAPAPQPFIHAYVSCDAALEGEVAHSCRHGTAPHRIKVCITKAGNEKNWRMISHLVGPKPQRRPS